MEYILFLLLILSPGGDGTLAGQGAGQVTAQATGRGQALLTTATFGDREACLRAAKVLRDKASDAGLGIAAVCLPRGSE